MVSFAQTHGSPSRRLFTVVMEPSNLQRDPEDAFLLPGFIRKIDEFVEWVQTELAKEETYG